MWLKRAHHSTGDCLSWLGGTSTAGVVAVQFDTAKTRQQGKHTTEQKTQRILMDAIVNMDFKSAVKSAVKLNG